MTQSDLRPCDPAGPIHSAGHEPHSIRRARSEEAALLSALALRSKAHWGYDADFMQKAVAELTLAPEAVSKHEVWVLEDARGTIVGFHRVIPGETAVLEDLWLEPAWIGAGCGRLLFEHAVSVARSGGATGMELVAEPHAVGFYGRMGAVQVGRVASTILPGRVLPRMRLSLE